MIDLSLVVAVAQNGGIGQDNRLPWRLPDDLRHFRALTLGKPVIMGRRTFESIGHPLAGRPNVVLSSHDLPGVTVARSWPEALAAAGALGREVMAIGGVGVFEAALPAARRIHLTEVAGEVEADTFFPAIDRERWQVVEQEPWRQGPEDSHPYRFLTLERL